MRGNKLEKSHIHILESETLSRESRVTEKLHKRLSNQSLITENTRPILPFVKYIILLLGGCFTRMWDYTWRVSDCEELVGGTHRR